LIPEPQAGPKAEEVLPDYVPEKRWEYTSMPVPALEREPSLRIDDVSFDEGSAALNREGFAVCRQVARWMRENSAVDVVLVGHASRLEGHGDGTDLGRRRAEAARNYLVRELGVPVGRLHISSFGNRFSKAGQSEPGLQKIERRVEFWSMR
jgi:OOP family OmpA-OmpF porin